MSTYETASIRLTGSRADVDRLRDWVIAQELELDYKLRVEQGRPYEDAVSMEEVGSGFVFKDNVAYYEGGTIRVVPDAILGLIEAVKLLTRRIEALEARPALKPNHGPAGTLTRLPAAVSEDSGGDWCVHGFHMDEDCHHCDADQ